MAKMVKMCSKKKKKHRQFPCDTEVGTHEPQVPARERKQPIREKSTCGMRGNVHTTRIADGVDIDNVRNACNSIAVPTGLLYTRYGNCQGIYLNVFSK